MMSVALAWLLRLLRSRSSSSGEMAGIGGLS